MKQLTQTQQAIIDSLTNEFNRINNEFTKGSFNLININPLMDKTREIKENEKIAELDKQMWHRLAMDEAQRIAELLSEDLPFGCVKRCDKMNGYTIDAPSIRIQKGIRGLAIDIEVVTEWAKQSHGCVYKKGIRLAYKYPYDGRRYDSIEELFKISTIVEDIRNKIISQMI